MQLLVFICLFRLFAQGLTSPFPGSIEGLDIANTHFLTEEESVIRGMRPRSDADYQQLKDKGVTHVLMLQKKVEEEQLKLEEYELTSTHIHLNWKGHTDFKTTCKKVVKIFAIIDEYRSIDNEKLFLHCTVGEDRTGFIAGLDSIRYSGNTPLKAFQTQMCPHGYAEANPNKPYGPVVREIQKSLTPIYIKIARIIEKHGELTNKLCETLPDRPPIHFHQRTKRFRCKKINLNED